MAQDRPTLPPNSISAGADGKFEAAPDTAVVDFNISVQDENSHTAYDRASQQAEQVRQILRANSIDPKTAQIGSFSLQPVYDYKTPKRKLAGYRVSASVSVKLKDFGKIPPILQALADASVSDTQSLGYTLEEMDSAKTQGRGRCLPACPAVGGSCGQGVRKNFGRAVVRFGRYVRKYSDDPADGRTVQDDGRVSACSDRGIHTADAKRDCSRKRAIQSEMTIG